MRLIQPPTGCCSESSQDHHPNGPRRALFLLSVIKKQLGSFSAQGGKVLVDFRVICSSTGSYSFKEKAAESTRRQALKRSYDRTSVSLMYGWKHVTSPKPRNTLVRTVKSAQKHPAYLHRTTFTAAADVIEATLHHDTIPLSDSRRFRAAHCPTQTWAGVTQRRFATLLLPAFA